jgi:regulator of replication initiation timing
MFKRYRYISKRSMGYMAEEISDLRSEVVRLQEENEAFRTANEELVRAVNGMD